MSSISENTSKYNELMPKYRSLLEETVFILSEEFREKNIKVHSISSRTKEITSLLKKCEQKNILDPFKEIADIAGVRVVCLFRSDLDLIDSIIKSNFMLVSKDDKISSNDGFGYMSVHYVCKIKSEYHGPRYNHIRELVVEIQARTLCMDAWAAVSHYLAYKGEWDVPAELSRAMNALSGLFYVADNQFEQVYHARGLSLDSAASDLSDKVSKEIPINLDTLTAYMKEKFPDRISPDNGAASDLVHQIREAGYKSIQQVDRDIDEISEIFSMYEHEHPPEVPNGKLFDVGAVRLSLALISDGFEKIRARDKYKPYEQNIGLKKYRNMYLEKTGKPRIS